mmetsp:Transcript_59141/g.105541  ORF Transcript_59141/g.105541 Transcript_59141/m.105541 type:complete len:123 (+) Transcript_59141:224-592(+)
MLTSALSKHQRLQFSYNLVVVLLALIPAPCTPSCLFLAASSHGSLLLTTLSLSDKSNHILGSTMTKTGPRIVQDRLQDAKIWAFNTPRQSAVGTQFFLQSRCQPMPFWGQHVGQISVLYGRL